MSDLRLPRPSSLWRTVELAPLPAALAGLLIVALALQIALPVPAELPEAPLAPLRQVRLATPEVTPATIDPIATRAPVFSPARQGGAVAAAGIGAMTLIGTAGSRSGAIAIVRDAAGNTTMLRPGQSFGSWRLLAVGPDRAAFDSDGARHVLRIGEAPAVSTPDTATQP